MVVVRDNTIRSHASRHRESYVIGITPLDLKSLAGNDLLNSISGLAPSELIAGAARLGRAFSLSSPLAPGFCCIGGVVALDDEMASAFGSPSVSVTGNGETHGAAFVSCLGEATELLSQF